MASEASAEKYCLDAVALIQLHQHYPNDLPRLGKLCRDNYVCIPEGVYREIRLVTDGLKRQLDDWEVKHSVVTRLRHHTAARALLPEIERKYGEKIRLGGTVRKGLWSSKSGQRSADAQVIAIAKAGSLTVVSNDHAVNDACLLEDVPCITWQEFARRLRAGQIGA